MSMARMKTIGSTLFVVLCFQYMIFFYIFNQSHTPFKHKLLPRHVTTKEVRGPTYHVHKVDPMPIALRERYESRRLLVQSNRPRLVSRREILDEYRSSAQSDPTLPTELRYISLKPANRRGELLSCETCSLVSNSGHTIRSGQGDEIDKAECVFRLNAAPSIGYELDVGRRTTVRVVSHRAFRELLSNASTLLNNHPSLSTVFIHGPDHVFSLGSLPGLVKQASAKYPKVDFYRPSKAVEVEMNGDYQKFTGKSRLSTGTEFSTGLYALMIMKDICGDIKVYGVTPEDYCSMHPDSTVVYSYYKTPSLPECMMYDYHEDIEQGGQRLRTERRLFHNWAKTKAITFYNPSWD